MRNLLICIFLVLPSSAVIASGDYDSAVYTIESDIAAEGWDPVSFFADKTPEEGSPLWQIEYKEALWYFSSEENLNLFIAEPDKYSPAYGGYCAWAMSSGKLAPGRAEHWDIIDGRLYFNYSSSTRKKFLADITGMIRDADEKWPEIESKLLMNKTE